MRFPAEHCIGASTNPATESLSAMIHAASRCATATFVMAKEEPQAITRSVRINQSRVEVFFIIASACLMVYRESMERAEGEQTGVALTQRLSIVIM